MAQAPLAILAFFRQFLRIAPNWVDTNFREHGFSHPEAVPAESLALFIPALRGNTFPEPQN
jgi:hypothetical protein